MSLAGATQGELLPVERTRLSRRICWAALCQCSVLPFCCKVGARGTCNGKLQVRITNNHRKGIRQVCGILGFLQEQVRAI